MSVTFTPDQQAEVDRIVGDRLARDRQARVTHEPRTYALDGPFSWYLDLSLIIEGAPGAKQARERQVAYARELGSEMARGTKEGRRAERCLRSAERHPNPEEHERRFRKRVTELRAFGTDGGASASSPGEAAAFVSPFFLTQQWAAYRGFARAFADQCHPLPLPPYGMKVYLPYFSTTSPKVTAQTEGSSVAEGVPVTALESTTVETLTGQLIISQQQRDRAVTGGGAFDAIVQKQLQQQLDERTDIYALSKVLEASIGEVTSSAELKEAEKAWPEFLKDVAAARYKVTTEAEGVHLRPTHVFTTSAFYGYMTRLYDKQERLMQTPAPMPGFPVETGADDWDSGRLPAWARYSGTVLPGQTVWILDDNIPNKGTTTQTQLLVGAPSEAVILMEDMPVCSVFTETLGNTLRTVINLRNYAATVVRHAGGMTSITGAHYSSTLK